MTYCNNCFKPIGKSETTDGQICQCNNNLMGWKCSFCGVIYFVYPCIYCFPRIAAGDNTANIPSIGYRSIIDEIIVTKHSDKDEKVKDEPKQLITIRYIEKPVEKNVYGLIPAFDVEDKEKIWKNIEWILNRFDSDGGKIEMNIHPFQKINFIYD